MEEQPPRDNSHKAWAQGKKPSMKRRCEPHNYRDRGIYMLTLCTEGRRPLFGSLKGDTAVAEGPDRPHIELTALGRSIAECWRAIPLHYPAIRLLKLCIMPDHIHGVLFVQERMEQHLGQVVNGFKAGTRKAARELGILAPAAPMALPTEQEQQDQSQQNPNQQGQKQQGQKTRSSKQQDPQGQSSLGASPSVQYAEALPRPHSKHSPHGQLWEPGYNDRLLLHKGQLDRMLSYLDDNPRRLLLKRQHPEFFTNLGTLTVAGIPMQAMGNRHLLDNPVKLQVQCSRHLYQSEIDERRDYFLDEGRAGAVLVSPCISPGESQIATAALEADIPLIVLLLRGFHPHFKPKPRYLAACTAGRLLMLAPFPWQNEKIEHMRSRCLQLNELARRISDM
jgi:REP element-mobilizing transposase RayT